MNNKLHFVLAICVSLLCCNSNSFAQDLTINWGPDITKEELKAEYKRTSNSSLFSNEKGSFNVSKYLDAKKARFVESGYIKNKLVLFFFTHDKAEKKINLFAQEFNERIELEKEPIYITSNPLDGSDSKYCGFKLQKYGDKILAYYHEFDSRLYKPTAIRFALINSDLTLDWETLFPMNKEEVFNGVKFETLTDGDQNLVALIKLRKKNNVYVHQLIRYGKENSKQIVQPVDMGESKYVTECMVSINNTKKTIYLTQLYTNLGEMDWGIEGVLSLEYSLETLLKNKSQRIPFSNELLLKIMTKKQVEKNNKPNVVLLNVGVNIDGSLTLLIEEKYTLAVRVGNSSSSTHIYGSIILMKINLEEGLVWDYVVSKQQSYSDYESLSALISVGYIFDNNYTYLLFNTDTDKLNNSHEYKLKDLNKNPIALVLIIIDSNGKKVKEGIVKTPDYPVVIKSLYKSKKDGKYYITARKHSDMWGIPEQENIGEIILK